MIAIGVDAHKGIHMAVAVDEAGREVARRRGPNSVEGWQQVAAWASSQRGGGALRSARLGPPQHRAMRVRMSPVVIVGAGIVDASVAYHLARRGVPVTLIERASAPAAGVTGASFAWIGDTGGEWPGGAEDLRESVLRDYRRLGAEVPGVAVR